MKRSDIRRFEGMCTENFPPGCSTMCPMHVDVKAMTNCVSEGDFEGGAKVLQKSIIFPRIISSICDRPCQSHCIRQEIGGSILISNLEKACMDFGGFSEKKTRVSRHNSMKIAVIGGGLSSLAVAYYLYEKGYEIDIFEKTNRLGGTIWDFVPGQLSEEAIEGDFSILKNDRITIHYESAIETKDQLADLKNQYDGLYLGIPQEHTNLFQNYDKDTLQTDIEYVFAGGSAISENSYSAIRSIADGKKAAISLDRYSKKVSMTEGRINEGSYKTELFTETKYFETEAPAFQENSIIKKEEAVKEAARCIQCRCMECVKQCPFLSEYGDYPKKYVREIANNVNIMMGIRQTKNLVSSCTFCGLCKEICPNDLSMAEVCMMGKLGLTDKNALPEAIHDFPIQDMNFSNSDHFAMYRHQPGMDNSKYAFFPGCQLGALQPDHVKLAYEDLCKTLEGGVGLYLRCCGAPAKWAGREELFLQTVKEFKEIWEKAGSPILITACATCTQTFMEEVEGLQCVSLWEIFDKNNILGDVSMKGKEMSLHDACTARHDEAIQEHIRNIIEKKGIVLEELAYSKSMTKCCGYGGLVSFANKAVAKEFILDRINEGDKEYIVYCAMCKDNFTSEGKPSYHMLDLIYGGSPNHAQLTFSRRHENRIKLKESVLRELWGEKMDTNVEEYENLKLILEENVESVIQDRLILESDIQKVIYNAEKTKNRILNPKTGTYTAKLKPGVLTYWVEYKPEEEAFRVYNAYSHRIEINRDVKENEHRKYRL